MRLYIVRHGKAEKDSATGRDADRVLRRKGEAQAAWLGRRLAETGASPDLILTSGIARAAATARMIASELGCPLQVEHRLETGHAAEEVAKLISAHADQPSLMLVGHNPQLEELLDLLLAPDADNDVTLRTGEAFVLELGRAADPAGAATLMAKLRMDDDSH